MKLSKTNTERERKRERGREKERENKCKLLQYRKAAAICNSLILAHY